MYNFVLITISVAIIGLVCYSEGSLKACAAYKLEVQRQELQAKRYQERFDKWCQTNKDCRYMKRHK